MNPVRAARSVSTKKAGLNCARPLASEQGTSFHQRLVYHRWIMPSNHHLRLWKEDLGGFVRAGGVMDFVRIANWDHEFHEWDESHEWSEMVVHPQLSRNPRRGSRISRMGRISRMERDGGLSPTIKKS